MKTTAENMGNYILYNYQDIIISNKKLQKLLYYSAVWYYVFKGKKLFDDEFEAWVQGPVIPLIYHKYKKYKFPIIPIPKQDNMNILVSDKEFFKEVLGNYLKYDSDYLERMSHQEEPWILSRRNLDLGKSNIIDIEASKEFYKPSSVLISSYSFGSI